MNLKLVLAPAALEEEGSRFASQVSTLQHLSFPFYFQLSSSAAAVFGPAPQREAYSSLKQHGFARNSKWTFEGQEDGQGWSQAKFRLTNSHDGVQSYNWAPFVCLYTVKLCDGCLSTELEVKNLSDKFFEFQALLHTYLRLPKTIGPHDVTLKSLKGLKFTDKAAGGIAGCENREEVDFKAGEVDRVYHNVPSEIQVKMGDKKEVVVKIDSLPDVEFDFSLLCYFTHPSNPHHTDHFSFFPPLSFAFGTPIKQKVMLCLTWKRMVGKHLYA